LLTKFQQNEFLEMNAKIITFAVALLFVASCSLSATPTSTPTISASETPIITQTIVPSETLTSTPTVTPTIGPNYSFSLEKEIVDVIWNDDGSLTLSYEFTFTNDISASPIDFVDVYIPSQNYILQNTTAEVDGIKIHHIEQSTFFPGAVELGLNQNAIPAGGTGNVLVQINNIRDVLYMDPDDESYVNAIFFPTWFDRELVQGTTDLTVIFHLPTGVHPNEIRLHQPPPEWHEEPIDGVDELERITYTWNNPDANGHTPYLFGVSFPKIHIPEIAIKLPEQLDRRYAEGFNNRGKAYLRQLDYDSAIADFTQAIILNPQYAEAYSHRGTAYAYNGVPDSAINDANRAIEIDPQYAPAYNTRGLAYYSMGNVERAFLDFDQAISLDPLFALAYSNRGLIYANNGDNAHAIEDYEQAIALDPKLFAVYINLGLYYLNTNDLERAISNFDEAITLNPSEPLAYSNRGLAYALSASYDQALNDLNKAIEISPQFALAYHNRGLTYMLMFRYDEALEDFDIANKLNPLFANTYYLRGFLYYEIGEVDKSVSDLERALEIGLDPNAEQIAKELLRELGQ
jgi:tetratricopeptide (TPR) repeat protein